MNWFDRFVSFVSPSAGLRRQRAREVSKILHGFGSRGYDGASSGRRTGGWTTASTSANTEIQGGLIQLRNRARDLVRNNPWAARAVQAFASNLVGPGIMPSPKHKTDSRAKAAEKLWKLWAETPACDFNGRMDFYGLQAQAARAIFESGEVLIRRYLTRASAGLPIPLQLQVLESDYLDALRNNLTTQDGGYIMQGVEYDADGKRVAYWLFKRHPGDIGLPLGGLVSERVPASEILHIFRVDRPGQNRGASWFSPVLMKLRDFDDYEDAQLVRQKIAACFSVFTIDAESEIDTGSNETDDDFDRVEPGMIKKLNPGQDVKFAEPPGVDGYGDYSRNVLRSIAAGLNQPYEVLTGDLSQSNFSAGRMGWLEFHRSLSQWTWSMFIPQFCDPVWAWFIEAASLVDPKADDVDVAWIPPRREMINPSEEIKAALAAIRAGLQSRQDFVRSLGNDPDQVTSEIAADNAAADAAGLILDSDPRRVTQVGILQIVPKPADPASADGEPSDPPAPASSGKSSKGGKK